MIVVFTFLMSASIPGAVLAGGSVIVVVDPLASIAKSEEVIA
jgi:hypothetical protein